MRISICWWQVVLFMLGALAAGHYFGRPLEFLGAAVVVHIVAVILAMAQSQQPAPPELHSTAYGIFFRVLWTFVAVVALKNPNAGLGAAIFALWLSPIGRSPDASR